MFIDKLLYTFLHLFCVSVLYFISNSVLLWFFNNHLAQIKELIIIKNHVIQRAMPFSCNWVLKWLPASPLMSVLSLLC